MDVVVVNTTRTNEPAGWWKANNEHAANCDYLIEENHGEISHIYTFSRTSGKDNNNRFSFLNLIEVEDSIIIERIKKNINVKRKRGEGNPVRYFTI